MEIGTYDNPLIKPPEAVGPRPDLISRRIRWTKSVLDTRPSFQFLNSLLTKERQMDLIPGAMSA